MERGKRVVRFPRFELSTRFPFLCFVALSGVSHTGNRYTGATTVAANVAELVDALDLGSSGGTRGSSSLPIRTITDRFLREAANSWPVCSKFGMILPEIP